MSHMRKLSEPHRVAPFAKGFGGRRNTFTSERDAVEQDTDLFSGPGNADGSYQESDGPLQRFVRRYLMDATLDWFCLVFIAQVMVMSWGHMMAANAEPFMFMGYHVPAPKMQIFTSITTLPMVLKPLIGLMSDLFPIFGYNKSPYVMVTSLVGIVACILLGSAPGAPMGGGISSLLAFGPNVGPSRFSAGTVVGCCFFVNLMITTCDVLTQGKLATKVNEVSKQEEKTGNKGATNDIIAGFVIMARIGGLGSAVCCSLIITNFGAPRVYIACAIIMVALPIFVAIRGFGEKPLSSERIAERRKFFAGQKETVGLTLLLFLGCMINIFIPMIGGNSVKLNFIVSMITSALIVVPFSVFLTPVLARLNFVFFAVSAIHVDVSGALMYWMTDNAYQYPGGPNFTRFFVTFWIPAMGMVAGGFGCFMYKVLSKGWSLKQWQALNAIIWIPVLLIDIPWVNRWNIDWGLSDCWMAIIRNLLAFFLVAMRLMPYSFIIPRLCPPGMEATMSAVLFGCAQMGHTVSEDLGALVLQLLDVTPEGAFFEQRKFDQFWKVSVIQIVVTWVVFVATIPCLPAIGMEEQLLANRHDAASHGSLWKRWRQRVAQKSAKGSSV